MMLSITRSIVPYTGSSTRQRFISAPNSCVSESSKLHMLKCQFLGNQRLQMFHTSLELLHASKAKMDMAVYSGVEPGPALPSDPSPGSWKVWILGMVISVILPFWRNKWWPLLMIKDKFESVVETADDVVDIVEEVAEGVGKVAEEVADHLPDGGKLKQAVTFVENVANETAKHAHLIDEVIEKVEELEKEVESFTEQVAGHANGTPTEAKDS